MAHGPSACPDALNSEEWYPDYNADVGLPDAMSMFRDSGPDVFLREQDRLLPIANIARRMSAALPPGVKISRQAKVLMQEAVTEFICFITSEANDLCLLDQSKAVRSKHLLWALEKLGELQSSARPLLLYHMYARVFARKAFNMRRHTLLY